jgi:hypothetical protein
MDTPNRVPALGTPRSPVNSRAAGARGTILVRGDSAYGKNSAVQTAIGAIPAHAWTPVRYPGAVRDPDTGEWISDAEVAETHYTAFASTPNPETAG